MNDFNSRSRMLVRSAREVRSYRYLMKLLSISVSAIVLLLVCVYVISLMYDKFGAYTVSVDKFDKVQYSLSLSESAERTDLTSRLNARASERITNISEDEIATDVDSNTGGSKSGTNYLAYTYWLINTGLVEVDYEYELYIKNVTNNLDKAIRVRLYIDGVPTTFARSKSDGTAEEGTQVFQTTKTIVKKEVTNFKVDDATKFTVVIWIEGEDEDCTDELLGGQFKIDMKITVVRSYD